MAVQAQYPSNVLLLNRNAQEGKNKLGNDYSLQPQPSGGGFLDQSHMIFTNGDGRSSPIPIKCSAPKQEGKNKLGNDYSLQPQPSGGGFLDQSHMIFTNGVGTNPRKRGREISATTSPINNNPFSIQLQSPQIIDLTQLHTQQSNVVSTGLRLAFGEQQQQLQSQQQQQRTLSPQSSVLFSLLSDDLTTQIRQQREEMEQFIQAQGEHLRRTIAEKRQRHYHALLGAAEETAARRLREKDAEVEKAARRNAELEVRATQLSAEARAWHAKARAEEATVASLQEQLKQAIISGGAGGVELGCAGGADAEDAESAHVDPARVEFASGPSCKACRRRAASVVVLPCRHLSLCTDCGAVAQACPVCLAVRESSVEVFLC
ncbi:BOI-related E3 ubiquitin-protein like [Actinidia chinensis var. chinensis]|uniref:BOI-related E3 ubiquitin-protein like n=1 Tax=Actinidia chinensis var. chinensis TaxID=1590841 RepID=A0A2R6PIG5_ACTCC|nr:BOI-related E3 ubiquitin-protein like [Actinidia chinensis var. chinensis]